MPQALGAGLGFIIFFGEVWIAGFQLFKLALHPCRFPRQQNKSDQQKQNALQNRQEYSQNPEDDEEPAESEDNVALERASRPLDMDRRALNAKGCFLDRLVERRMGMACPRNIF